MRHTFTGLVQEVANRTIHVLVAHALTIRKQLMARPEFLSQSGWNDNLQLYIRESLSSLRVLVSRGVYSPVSPDAAAAKAQRIAEAKDTGVSAGDQFDGKSINSDDVVMPAEIGMRQLPYDFTGTDPDSDFPQPTPQKIPNDMGRSLIAGLDGFVVACTNLDSRFEPSSLNSYNAAQLDALINELYTMNETMGGEVNRLPIPTGVQPSQRASTFNADGALDPKTNG